MNLLLLFSAPGTGELIILLLPVVIIAVIISITSGKKEREMENLNLEPIDLSKVRTDYKGSDIFLNILWHIIPPFGGLVIALATALGGLFWCITIVGLPLGLGLLQYAKFLLWPHGHAMLNKKYVVQLTGEKQNALWKTFSVIVRILYFPFGLIHVVALTLAAFLEFISIIGIPAGLVYVKSLSTVFNPVNKICVPATVLKIMEERMMAAIYRKSTQPDVPAIDSNNVPPEYQPILIIEDEPSNDSFNTPSELQVPKPENFVTEQEEIPTSTESSGNRNLLLITVALALLFSVGGYFGYTDYYLPRKIDREAPRFYTFANITNLRSSEIAGTDFNIVEKLPYGAELITYSNNTEWSRVKLKTGNKSVTGYISSVFILPKDDFFLLNSVFGDNDSRACINTGKCRMALLDYLKRGALNKSYDNASGEYKYTGEWQVYTKPEDVKPNTVLYPRLFNRNSKFTDFVFIIKNNTTGVRRIVVYSFEDDETPVFRYEGQAQGEGYLKNVIWKEYGGDAWLEALYTN
ncbi:MAG: hypothetical protein LBE91_13720 [Tannerella sp.]|jgi:uncharacterized membrane protein YccF (DUF307 family)|nr:hypothetical protein [Tannerella sp.]